MHAYCEKEKKKSTHQGGRHWQPLGGRKNGHKIFCQARIFFFFGDKCVAFWSGQFNLVKNAIYTV